MLPDTLGSGEQFRLKMRVGKVEHRRIDVTNQSYTKIAGGLRHHGRNVQRDPLRWFAGC